MRTIDSLDSLNIPNDYKKYITHYLSNLKKNKLFPYVNKIILFGSCAKETVKDSGDIDIFLITNIELMDNPIVHSIKDRLSEASAHIDLSNVRCRVQTEELFILAVQKDCYSLKRVRKQTEQICL